ARLGLDVVAQRARHQRTIERHHRLEGRWDFEPRDLVEETFRLRNLSFEKEDADQVVLDDQVVLRLAQRDLAPEDRLRAAQVPALPLDGSEQAEIIGEPYRIDRALLLVNLEDASHQVRG